MQSTPEQKPADIGSFNFEVYGAGRHGRRRSSKFTLRCDAVGLHDDEILSLSIVGPETSVKALTAGLRSTVSEQKRIEYAAHVGPIHRTFLSRCDAGYRLHRTKLDYGLWHVLCLSQRDGFMPVLTEDSVWQLLQGDQFTTPLVRDWMPWLYQRMKTTGALVELTQSGCQAGLLGARWQPAYLHREQADGGFLRCPQCGLRMVTEDREPLVVGKPGHNGQSGTGLWKHRAKCEWVFANHLAGDDPDKEESGRLVPGCGSPLWQINGELWRHEPALYIKRHLRNFSKYLILDEVHEEKGSETAQGHAAGALAAACQKVLALEAALGISTAERKTGEFYQGATAEQHVQQQ